MSSGGWPEFQIIMAPRPGSMQRAFSRAAEQLSHMTSRDVPREFAEQIANTIRERTRIDRLSAEGRSGGRFTPYTKDYAEDKGVPQTHVDLTLSGQMLDSMHGRMERDAIIIYFKGRHEDADMANHELAAIHHKGIPPMPERPFFDLTEEEEDFVVTAMQRILEHTITRLEDEMRGRGVA